MNASSFPTELKVQRLSWPWHCPRPYGSNAARLATAHTNTDGVLMRLLRDLSIVMREAVWRTTGKDADSLKR